MITKPLIAINLALMVSSHALAAPIQTANYTSNSPIIDGSLNDEAWLNANWYPLDKHILGQRPLPVDFSGRYKISWDSDFLYILAEITDDILFDQHADPRHLYWDDDALEIFVDEDMSGGDHQHNYNAFAYHVALDGQAADIGPKNPDNSVNFVLLNDHLHSVWKRAPKEPNKIIWETALKIFSEDFSEKSQSTPVKLHAEKKLGFMLAYCDNDGSPTREHFVGSHEIEPVNGDKNRGYIDASVFGTLQLVKPNVSSPRQQKD